MAVKPKIVTLTNSSVDILNAIRNNATNNYRDYVPYATNDADSIREIGAIIMDYPVLQNEFLNALVNRIGRVIITSKMYSNPLAMFKQGILEFGESVEEIFVNIAKPFTFDPAVAENKVFQREIPDVRSAFHILNYQKFYKATVSQDQLRQAFLSWDGITDLISKIVDSMYTAANYDEFQVTMYMLGKQILNGRIKPIQCDAAPLSNPAAVVSKVKATANKLTFMPSDYNVAGVKNPTPIEDAYVLINSDFEAVMNVEVLASAFNMSKADFMGHVVLVPSFGAIDTERLGVLFDGDPTYTEITEAELTALDAIPVVIVDKNYFMIFDNMLNFTEQYNGEGLYWNYWYHTWKTFSVSPFANAALFVPSEPSITSVTVVPDAVSVPNTFVGSIPLAATVVTSGFASKAVNWELKTDISTYTGFDCSITDGGVVQITNDSAATVPATITIRATSVVDSTKYDECVITLAAGA